MTLAVVKKLKSLSKKKLPNLYCSPLIPPRNEEEAVAWATKRGAKTLYYFPGGKLYLVDAE